MAIDDLEAKISYLMGAAKGEQGDLHEIKFRLDQAISTMRAEGLPVMEDPLNFEMDLDRMLSAKS
jgi:hypothetical protein